VSLASEQDLIPGKLYRLSDSNLDLIRDNEKINKWILIDKNRVIMYLGRSYHPGLLDHAPDQIRQHFLVGMKTGYYRYASESDGNENLVLPPSLPRLLHILERVE